MARCDEGYLCEVCGAAVESLAESALYLQYVIGWIDPETLHTRRECHVACLPSLAQFISAGDFPELFVDGEFDKRKLDPTFVQQRTNLVTRGYLRIQQLQLQR
ncbi:MAG: hypothetical protein KDA44_21190, partial [Planctomycetales bacterium]|nr:hypothetical protein [Planctomycetales bacterium]